MEENIQKYNKLDSYFFIFVSSLCNTRSLCSVFNLKDVLPPKKQEKL
jgi:hypothetical protein